MKNRFLNLLIFVLILNNAEAYASSIWALIDGLRSEDPVTVEKVCKALKIEEEWGALGPSRVQVLQPCCIKSNNYLFVIAISNEGPLDGYLILLDSKGKILDKRRVGYIKSLALRPSQTIHNDDLVIDAIEAAGTGMEGARFSIFSLTNQKFNELWKDLSYEIYSSGGY